MKPFSLQKHSLIRKSEQYDTVYKRGRRVRGKGFNLIFRVNGLENSRIGISVSGMRLAVTRHKIKRLIREFYRLNRSFPSQIAKAHGEHAPVDLVFATRREFQPRTFAELSKLFQNCLLEKCRS